MTARPSGAAITVSAPLSSTTAPLRAAAARARVSLSPSRSNRRRNSPSCGVRRQGPAIAPNSWSGRSAKLVKASASSTQALPLASAAMTRWQSASPTPAPGPSRIALRRGSSSCRVEARLVSEGRDHDRGQLRGVGGERGLGADHRDQARPGAERGPGGHTGRAGRGDAATQDQRVAIAVLVARGGAARQVASARAADRSPTAGCRAGR